MTEQTIKAELLFLVTKFLEEESCTDAAQCLKKYINSKAILPARINTDGTQFPNSFENFERSHGPVQPGMLLNSLSRLLDCFKHASVDASRIESLFSLSYYLDRNSTFVLRNAHLGSYLNHATQAEYRHQYLSSIHRRMRPANHCLAHRNAVYCLQQDQRNEFIFTGSDDYTIKVWDLRAKSARPCSLRHVLRGHIAEIIELAISPDNHLLASVDSNCCLVWWCLRTGEPVVSVRGSRVNRVISGMAFLTVPLGDGADSSDHLASGSTCSMQPSGWLAITSFGGFLHMIPFRHQLVHHESCPSTTNRWRCCTVHLLPTVRFITGVDGTHNVFWPSVVCMDVSPGSLLVATGCSDQCIRLYHMLNPRKPELSATLRAHEESVNSVAFSHSGLRLASGSSDGGSCWLWRYQAGKWRSMVLAFRKRVKCRPCLLAWSQTDRYLIASMKNGAVYVYFGDSGHLATVIEGHEGAVHAISPSPLDDEIVATGGVDGRFQVWNIRLHRRLVTHADSATTSESSSSSPVKRPLLYHYRYCPCEFDPDHGLVWRPLEPSEAQPIGWTNPITVGRRPATRDPVGPASRSTPGQDVQDAGQLSVGGVTVRHQRITACRGLPTSEGVGFLVVTKSGLLSVFQPSDLNPEFPEDSVGVDQASLCAEEQFFHWELDTAEWKEVTTSIGDPPINLVLGSPPASQSALDLSGARYGRDGRATRPERVRPNGPLRGGESLPRQPVGTPALPVTEAYQPAAGVCFEVIHAPSQVPFHRLPPPYLTTLRGVPLPAELQRQVPGRSHLLQPEDLLPTLSMDDELGEDVVVDDIQFCPNVPSDYCPAPVQSSAQHIPGKQYLWQSVWLDKLTPLIEPLNATELQHKLHEHAARYRDEVDFFTANGDARVSFGDEFINSLPQRDRVLPMQPTHRLGSTRAMREQSRGVLDRPAVRPAKHRRLEDDSRRATNSSSGGPVGMSFIHSFLAEQGANATAGTAQNSTRSLPDPQSALTLTVPDNTGGPTTQPTASSERSMLDELDDQDEDENDSEESEWSEHIDVDIGWWHRQHRRRRHRRTGPNDHAPSTAHSTDDPVNGNHPEISSPGSAAAAPSSRHRPCRISGQRRRSLRQQRRAFVRRRLLREKRLNEIRIDRERRKSNSLLRSLRSRAPRSPEPSTSHIPDSRRNVEPPDLSSVAGNTSEEMTEEDLISERRERLKRRLIRSIDHLVETATAVPLTRYLPDGYQGPDCEGPTYPSTIPGTPESTAWAGPHFDWLSTYHPVPAPYVPQVGDQVVYIRRGHREYLHACWKNGTVPQPDELRSDFGAAKLEPTPATRGIDLTSIPWQVWPDCPPYVCGEVAHVSYSLIRVVCGTDNAAIPSSSSFSGTGGPAKPKRTQQKTLRRSRPYGQAPPSAKRPSGVSSDQFGQESFVRLVTLQLSLADSQPYAQLGRDDEEESSTRTAEDRQHQHAKPQAISVTYHDVDGVLDFIILRTIFDRALERSWNPGDPFLCPVGTVWWRGHVINSNGTSGGEGTVIEPIASCSTVTPVRPCPDPWLSVSVRWMDRSVLPELQATDEMTGACHIDSLSPWDLHPWDPAHLASGSDSSGSGPCVQLSAARVRQLYGTATESGRVDLDGGNHQPAFSSARVLKCIRKIMQLPISEHFTAPVDLASYPDYLFVNPFPVDLSLIATRLACGFYRQLAAVLADVQLMLDNTVRYNQPDSLIVRDAQLVHTLCTRCCLGDDTYTAKTVERDYHHLVRDNSCPIASSSALQADSSKSRDGSPDSASQTPHPRRRSARCSSLGATQTADPVPPANSQQSTDTNPAREVCPDCVLLTPRTWVNAFLTQLKRLLTHRQSIFFREPINTELYTDYLSVVSCPMDLSTIQHRLETTLTDTHRTRLRSGSRHSYHCPHECLHDLRLIVSNSEAYNRDPATAVFDDTRWLANWIHTVLEPLCDDRLTDASVRNDLTPSGSSQTSRPGVQIRMRQSKLACRKLALRRNRKHLFRRRSVRAKACDLAARANDPAHGFQRTSSGRIVRPPKRDILVVPVFSDQELSDSDSILIDSLVSPQLDDPTPSSTVPSAVADAAGSLPIANAGSRSNSSSVQRRRSKRRRRRRTAMEFW